MKKTLLFAIIMMVALVGCSQAQNDAMKTSAAEDTKSAKDTQAKVTEEVEKPAEPVSKKTTVDSAQETEADESSFEDSYNYEPYSQIGCENLLSSQEFASACNQTVENLKITYKVGTKNCYVNINHAEQTRLTAGIVLLADVNSEEALLEFDRRLKVFNVGADQSVGEKAYEFPKASRKTINFLRDKYIVEVASDDRLCSVDGLLEVAKLADARLQQAK